MKSLMSATVTRMFLQTAVALAALATHAHAGDPRYVPNGISNFEELISESAYSSLQLFTNPQQKPPTPTPSWKKHDWERDDPDWKTATNNWYVDVRKPNHLPNPVAPEGLPSEDSFGSYLPPPPPMQPALGVPTRPDRTFSSRTGIQRNTNNSVRFVKPQPVPPQPAVNRGTYGPPQPTPRATGRTKANTDWGGLFGGVGSSLQETLRK